MAQHPQAQVIRLQRLEVAGLSLEKCGLQRPPPAPPPPPLMGAMGRYGEDFGIQVKVDF